MGKSTCKSLLGSPSKSWPSPPRPVRLSSPFMAQLMPVRYSKMESFIRSKYESRRWALDGPPPSDPSVLDDVNPTNQVPEPPLATVSPSHTVNSSNNTLSRTTMSPPLTTRQPQPHQLLSAAVAADRRVQLPLVAPSVAVPTAAEAQPKAPEIGNDLFNLDFHSPPSLSSNPNSTATTQPKKDVKQDILSLFSTNPAAPQSNMFGQIQSPTSAWDSFGVPQAQPQPMSMIGTNGVGAWGTSSGWSPTAPALPTQDNLWENPTPSQQKPLDLFGSDIWGGSSTASGSGMDSSGSGGRNSQKKDDAFGDIWGGFK